MGNAAKMSSAMELTIATLRRLRGLVDNVGTIFRTNQSEVYKSPLRNRPVRDIIE